jgi:hypothetical protein
MTMTDYFPVQPIGVGSIEVEAFGSYLCRMAVTHTVSIYTLAMHLRNWWSLQHPDDSRAKKNVVNATNPMLCGYGANVGVYVDIAREATGCSHIDRTTLLALKNALEPNGHGAVRELRAWCPACLDESIRNGDQFYDRLAWSLRFSERCSIHKIALVTRCQSCGADQRHYHHLGMLELCCSCKTSLRSSPDTWEVMRKPPLYEREYLDIVARISDGCLDVVAGAWGIFIQDFLDYLAPLGKKVSKFAYGEARRPSLDRERKAPQLSMMLKRCAAFGIRPSDLLTDPHGAAMSASLLEFARLDLPVPTRPRKSPESVELARARLSTEARPERSDPLPSLRQVARECGVSVGFLNFHFPELVKRFAHLRKQNLAKIMKARRTAALTFLLNGPIYEYPSPTFPSIDRLVDATSTAVSLSINESRKAVSAALKERFGRGAYEKYRKRRRRDATAKWPPL